MAMAMAMATMTAIRFVGMLPPNKLQDFFVRLVTGFGERVQPEETSDEELKDFTQKLTLAAGKCNKSWTVTNFISVAFVFTIYTVNAKYLVLP